MSLKSKTAPLGLMAAIALAAPVGWAQQTAADPGRFVSAPAGTQTTYHRKSEGSYGVFDGLVTWTLGRRDWNGRALVSSSSERHGIQLMEPDSHGVVVQLTSAGEPAMSFNPPVTYDWPLAVGKQWRSMHEMTQYAPPAVRPIAFESKVEALETVTVPGGTFSAYKVVTRSSFGEVEQNWVVPSLGLMPVKVVRDRGPNHPLGPGHLEGVMVARTGPAR